jgi:hypothetical protein
MRASDTGDYGVAAMVSASLTRIAQNHSVEKEAEMYEKVIEAACRRKHERESQKGGETEGEPFPMADSTIAHQEANSSAVSNGTDISNVRFAASLRHPTSRA